MLPNVKLRGRLNVREATPCETDLSSDRCGAPLLLFSGGADAWCTFVRHADEMPYFVSKWGGYRMQQRFDDDYDALTEKKEDIESVEMRLHGGIIALQHGRSSLIVSIDNRARDGA